MPDYLVTIEIKRTFELWVSAPDDEAIFKWGEGKDNNLSESTKIKLSQAEWIGEKTNEQAEIIEVLETF